MKTFFTYIGLVAGGMMAFYILIRLGSYAASKSFFQVKKEEDK